MSVSIADVVRRMASAGAPAEAIAIAIDAIEQAQREIKERRARNTERMRTVRAQTPSCANTVRAQIRTTDAQTPAPLVPPPPSPLETPSPTPLNPPAPKEPRTFRALRPDWPPDFAEQFWQQYPHKVGRGDAIKKLGKLARDGPVAFSELMSALHRYAAKTDDRPWCNPATWLNQQRWLDQPAANNGHHNGKSGRKTVHDVARELCERIGRDEGEDDDGVLPFGRGR
jgi:hypothetical protein